MNYEMFQLLLDTRIAQLMAEAEAERAAATVPPLPGCVFPRVALGARLRSLLPRQRSRSATEPANP